MMSQRMAIDDWRAMIDNTEAQSDAEPKETLNKQPPGPDSILHELGDCPTQSDVGLIEAAEIAEQCANGSFSKNEAMYLRGFADRLRARAADRRGTRPDASVGLIEAAEWLEKRMTNDYIGTPDFQKGKIYGISLAIDHLRSRAADRSRK